MAAAVSTLPIRGRMRSQLVSARMSSQTHTPRGMIAPPRLTDTRPRVILGSSDPMNIQATSSSAARSVRYIRSSTRCNTPEKISTAITVSKVVAIDISPPVSYLLVPVVCPGSWRIIRGGAKSKPMHTRPMDA